MINANNEKLIDTLIDKKCDSYYGGTKDNFVLGGEITVTITLAEYRTLVKEVATKEVDIKKANNDKYERDCRNNALEKEIAELKQKLFAYIETYGRTEGDETND